MVDKINGNSSYDYPNQKDGRKGRAVQAYENTPGRKAAAAQKADGRQRAGSHPQKTAQYQKGVILDLTSKKENRKSSEKERGSLLDTLREIVGPIVQWIKKFWESDIEAANTDTAESDAGGTKENTEMLPPLDEVNEIPDYETMVDDAVKSHDLRQLEQILTQNGAKQPAHHSDLLTYYDKWGKLVEMDDTARHRVLFGDKNILKL